MSWTPNSNDVVYQDSFWGLVHAHQGTFIESGLTASVTGSNNIVTIAGGFYYINGTRYEKSGSTNIDLASHVPSTANYGRFVIIRIDTSGNFSNVLGTAVDVGTNDDSLRVPDLSSSTTHCLLIRVRLENGTNISSTEIVDSCRIVRNQSTIFSNQFTTNNPATFEKIRLNETTDVDLTSTAHAFQIGASSGANLAMDINEIMARNNGSTAELFINGNGGNVSLGVSTGRLTWGGEVLKLKVDNDDGATAPIINFIKNSSTEDDNDVLGSIYFSGNDDSDTETIFSYIRSRSTDVTNASEDGEINFFNRVAGTLTKVLALVSNDATFSGGVTANTATFSASSDISALYASSNRDGEYDYVGGFFNTNTSTDLTTSVMRVGFQKTNLPQGDNRYIFFSNGSSVLGSINGQVTYDPFTGGHNGTTNSSLSEIMQWREGMILSSNGQIVNNNPNISNAFVGLELSNTAKDKKVMGVFTMFEAGHTNVELNNHREIDLDYHYDNSEGETIKCPLTHRDIDFEENIIQYNAVGEGMILVSNVDGDITNGDYITTSTYAGVGVLQDDDFLHSYTVAKCTEQVDWDSVEVDAELEIKVKLVACTYHCG